MLAVVGVAAAALGTGFLGNQVELWIQQFGVGSGDIEKPIDHVQVDFFIYQEQVGEFTPPQFRNVADCVLTTRAAFGQLIGTPIMNANPEILVTKDSEMTCKFTNEAGNVIAEATIGSPLIDDPNDPDCPQIFFGPLCSQIPGGIFPADEYNIVIGEPVENIHDVIVVVHANTYSDGDFQLPPP